MERCKKCEGTGIVAYVVRTECTRGCCATMGDSIPLRAIGCKALLQKELGSKKCPECNGACQTLSPVK